MQEDKEFEVYRHWSIPLSASKVAWKAAGFTVSSNSDVVGGGPYGFETLLFLAVAQDLTGDKAIAWALTEGRRRMEQDSMAAAIASSGDGARQLADAIRQSGEKDALERIIGRLTERTQYAVRAQLAGR